MRKCTGQNMNKWGFDAVFDVTCPNCGHEVEFFKDEITRYCKKCGAKVANDRKDFGCQRWCSADDGFQFNICPKFKRSKDRFSYKRMFINK
jgi:ribosomal protein S27E